MEKNYSIVNQFLNGQGSVKLIIYYLQESTGQEFEMRDMGSEPHLIFTTGEVEKLSGKGVYFLRTINCKVNCEIIDSEVIFGEVKDDTLKQVSTMICSVFLPLIRSMDNRNDWKECDEEQKKEFINVTCKFSDELEEGIKSLTDSIDTCKIDQSRISNNSDFEKSSYFENLFEGW